MGHKTKETYPTRPGSPTPCKQGLTMHLKYAVLLDIVVHENMKLGDNTLNNEGLSVKKKRQDF